jgi:CheY-like chemotaxis protein
MKHMTEDVIEADHDFKRRQSRMNRIYDFAAMGFFHMEDDPERSLWSSQTPIILGLPNNAVPSLESIATALCPADRERFLDAERESCRLRRPYTFELRLDDKGGAARHIRIWGDYEALPGESRVMRVGLIHDVTREADSREELRLAHQALSGTVEKQNRQLSQGIEDLKREIAARKTLEGELRAINEEIARQRDAQREYLKRGAYELRSLVNRLAMDKGGLREKPLSATLSLISTTIDNMNDFFEIQSGLSPLAETFSPKTAAEGWIADLDRAQINPDIDLHLTISPNIPDRIEGDPQRLQQITFSVVGFLLKTTGWGAVQFTLDYLAEKNLLILTASSPAIDEQVTEATFQPNPPKDPGKNGWMLSTIGPMVNALKGKVDLRFLAGNGIAISVLIPSKTKVQPAREAIDAELPILVVEDDEPSRFFLESIIRKSGYGVEAVALGREALTRLEEQRFSLVLLDIQLPDVDGVTIARETRNKNALNAKTPIIAVTGHATPEYRQRYEKAGIDQFIAKPFKAEALRKMVKGYLGA